MLRTLISLGGVAVAGVLALAVTLAIDAAGMGGEVLMHLITLGGAPLAILGIGLTLTMSAFGAAAIAAVTLATVIPVVRRYIPTV